MPESTYIYQDPGCSPELKQGYMVPNGGYLGSIEGRWGPRYMHVQAMFGFGAAGRWCSCFRQEKVLERCKPIPPSGLQL